MPDTHAPDLTAPDVTPAAEPQAGSRPAEPRPPWRWASPLLRRILLVNLVPLALLLAALLYLDQYQNGLLEAEVGTLREQARIYAGALGEAATRMEPNGTPQLVPEIARALLMRLTEPSPNAQAKVYAPDGQVVADSRVRPNNGGAVEPLPPPPERGQLVGAIGRIYDSVLGWLPHNDAFPVLDAGPSAAGADWQPDVRQEVRLTGSDQSREMPPYIRRTEDNRLLITVAEPVQRAKHTVGIVLLTREAREVDQSLLDVRLSILGLFGFALGLTVLMSWYLSLTIARPILRLARAAELMQEGRGRAGTVPRSLLARHDEVGELAAALDRSARALWDRMDAIERFAADVAHEIKNPLSSIRSAIETWRRIDDPEKQRRLLGIVGEDVGRLDRLISDISDASRIDAELSRLATAPVDVAPTPGGAGRHLRRHPRRRRPDHRAGAARGPPGGAGGGKPAGAGAAQPDRQRAQLLPARRAHRADGARGRRRGADQRRGRRPGHPRGQAGTRVRPLLFRAAAGRAVRPAFRTRPVDQPADRRGAEGQPGGRQPPRRERPRGGRALRAEPARGWMTQARAMPIADDGGTVAG